MNILVFYILTLVSSARAACPWTDTNLLKWSDPKTWGGSTPSENAEVVITGKRILLDASPPKLATLEISSDAVLVWGDVDGITLTVNYILVKGEFHIGSEDCPFTKKANILLTGKSDSTYVVKEFDTKFIGVAAGGTLELHGAPKKAWTKLIQTMPAAHRTCGVVYKQEIPRKSAAYGLHVAVWNSDGTLKDFVVFPFADQSRRRSFLNFQNFVDSIENGLIVAAAVYGNIGRADEEWGTVCHFIEKLGGIARGSSKLRKVGEYEAYAFITHTGDPTTTREEHQALENLEASSRTSMQMHFHKPTKLAFTSTSIVKGPKNIDTENDVVLMILSEEVAQPTITLRDDVSSWQTGDEIIVTSTDYDWKQVEEFKLLDCPSCSNNQIKLDGPFKYSHFGEITHGVDERAEVALLTRNIKIEGELQPECYDNGDSAQKLLCKQYKRDTFGGHMKFLRDVKAVHIEGVELYHLGQQLVIGTYPVHFHMADDVTGCSIANNSIHHTNNRCLTIHGTDGLKVLDNVCYDHLGHGFFFEDSAEQNNILKGNLGCGTRHGTQIFTDFHPDFCPKGFDFSCNNPATFWITHPNNYIDDNVAAGSEKVGFFITFALEPLTTSAARQKILGKVPKDHARYSLIGSFDGNTAHSNIDRGLMLDRLISNGGETPENTIDFNGMYDPREEPFESSPRATSYIRRLTLYKNMFQNMWCRGGNIIYDHISLADTRVNIDLVKSELSENTVQEIRDSVIIGETDNLGEPHLYVSMDHEDKPKQQFNRSFPQRRPETPIRGIQGVRGIILVNNTFFDKFNHWTFNDTWKDTYGIGATRHASAFGFRQTFPYSSFPYNGVLSASFGFCNNVDGIKFFAGNNSIRAFSKPLKDGTRQATFRDYNGVLTGIPNVQLVKPTPFFLANDCYFDKVFQMSVCPREYSRLSFFGDDGIFLEPKRKDYPMYMVRDDISDKPYHIRGDKTLEFLCMQNKSYIAMFNGTTPSELTIGATNLELKSYIRVGLCFPKSTTKFEVRGIGSMKGVEMKAVTSIKEIREDKDGSAYFWDKATGLFFITLLGKLPRGGINEDCPGKLCPKILVKRLDGGSERTDCYKGAYGPYKVEPENLSPITPPEIPCKRDTVGNRGAVNPSELAIKAPKFNAKCVTVKTDYQSCGRGNSGRRVGATGNCYALIQSADPFTNAAYPCFKLFGSIVDGSKSLSEMRQHIYHRGNKDIDYWIDGSPQKKENEIALTENNFFLPEEVKTSRKAGSICQIATENGCPAGPMWTKFSDNCYAHNDVWTSSLLDSVKLCLGEFTTLLTIHNTEEEAAIVKLLPNSNVWLEAMFSDGRGVFEWVDGKEITNVNWAKGNGPKAAASLGKCVIFSTTKSEWKNIKCEGSKKRAGVVCKGPAWNA